LILTESRLPGILDEGVPEARFHFLANQQMARKLLRIFEPLEGVRPLSKPIESHHLCAIFKRWTYWKQKQTVQKKRVIG